MAELPAGMVAAAQQAIQKHPFFEGNSATAFGFANAALKAALGDEYVVVRGWQPIETAPKDGTHVLVRTVPPGIRTTYMTHPPTVAHFFVPVDDANNGCWCLSVSQTEQPPIYPTEWMPIP